MQLHVNLKGTDKRLLMLLLFITSMIIDWIVQQEGLLTIKITISEKKK